MHICLALQAINLQELLSAASATLHVGALFNEQIRIKVFNRTMGSES